MERNNKGFRVLGRFILVAGPTATILASFAASGCGVNVGGLQPGISSLIGAVNSAIAGLPIPPSAGKPSAPPTGAPPTSGTSPTGGSSTAGLVPLTDMGTGKYQGFAGGLFPGGNTMPQTHSDAGAARAAKVQPLDGSGAPSAAGKVVLLSIGMSNTTMEFCSGSATGTCDPLSFMGQAAADAGVNHTTLAIENGAANGKAAPYWTKATATDYDRIRDSVLAPAGLTEKQVQAVWVKVADPHPTTSLPSAQADAFTLETEMGDIVRALATRYANLQQVFFSSRIYAGYATTTLNPEPYAYESGFAVKWLVQAQIDQMASGAVKDAHAGDLDYSKGAPWISWGPYLWADGATPRSDGLTWLPADFGADGTHPSMSGVQKVGSQLLGFFKSSPHTKSWFAR